MKQQEDSLDIQNAAAEIKLRAERRMGEMLQATERADVGRPTKNSSPPVTISDTQPPTLSDIGITRKQSSRWQQIAALPVAQGVDEVKDIRDKAEALAAYARQAKDVDLIQWATEIKVRAERRCGELLWESAEHGTRATRAYGVLRGANKHLSHDTTSVPTLGDMGISRDQSSRWQKMARMSEEHFEAAVSTAKEVAGEVTTAFMLRQVDHPNRTSFTGETEWYTPAEYIARAREVLGDIDLDPASNALAQDTIQARRYFSREENGLTQAWYGNVWMNPPFSGWGFAYPFMARAFMGRQGRGGFLPW